LSTDCSEEQDILLHYAKLLNNARAEQIISAGIVKDQEDAEILSSFYWAMVDKAVEDPGIGVTVLETEGGDVWLDYIFHSLNGYMVSNGYPTRVGQGVIFDNSQARWGFC
jgi:hypothetical protein